MMLLERMNWLKPNLQLSRISPQQHDRLFRRYRVPRVVIVMDVRIEEWELDRMCARRPAKQQNRHKGEKKNWHSRFRSYAHDRGPASTLFKRTFWFLPWK